MGDRDIVVAVIAGDPAGLAAAYDQYAASLHAYCRSLLGRLWSCQSAERSVADSRLTPASPAHLHPISPSAYRDRLLPVLRQLPNWRS